MVFEDLAGHVPGSHRLGRLHCVSCENLRTTGKLTSSKIWDCNSGEALHSFAHNHIVRSVALNPQQTPQYLLTVSQLAAL